MVMINVDSGKVKLDGKVRSEDEKKKIETSVKGISGVTSVENNLQVSAGTSTEPAPAPTPTPNQ